MLLLIAMLQGGARIEICSDVVLPAKITRGDVEYDVDVRNGRSVEQIATLNRLAFARLYAKHRRQMPVILDDAQVDSGVWRVARMCTTPTRISKDQIIVSSLQAEATAVEDLRAFATATPAGFCGAASNQLCYMRQMSWSDRLSSTTSCTFEVQSGVGMTFASFCHAMLAEGGSRDVE